MMEKELYAFTGEEIRRTDKGVLFKLTSGKEIWLPLSQVEIDDANNTEGDPIGIVRMPKWLVDSHHLVAG